MKFVQIGILVALVAVGALLFTVWRGQQEQALAPLTEPAPAADTLPDVEPLPSQLEVAAEPKPAKPSPAPQRKPARQPVETAQAPSPPEPLRSGPIVAEPPAIDPKPAVSQAAPALPPPPAPPRQATIPAGTLLSARLSETIESDKMQVGDTFLATLDQPLVVEGLVIAERGARLEGRVAEVQEAGKVKGLASLGIQLVKIQTSDGQRVELQTDTFRKEAEPTKKEDAAKIGLGAGIGAAIGAIAGGGKGAAIGAGAGGAAGTGAVLVTRGKPVVIPVETRIDFRVNAPVTVTERK